MAPRECQRHLTCAAPITRTSDAPPENTGRLTVLTDPGAEPFASSCLLRCFYLQSIAASGQLGAPYSAVEYEHSRQH